MFTSAGSPEHAWRQCASPTLVTHDRGRTVVWLRGEHDVSTTGLLRDTLGGVTSADDAHVIVDLRWVSFIDAATIGTLLQARQSLGHQSRQLVLRSPSVRARHVLDICGLTGLVEAAPHPAGGATVPSFLPSERTSDQE